MYDDIISTVALFMAGFALVRSVPVKTKTKTIKLPVFQTKMSLRGVIEERNSLLKKKVAKQIIDGKVPKDNNFIYRVSDIPVGGIGSINICSTIELINNKKALLRENSLADSGYPQAIVERPSFDKWVIISTAENLSADAGNLLFSGTGSVEAELELISEEEFEKLKEKSIPRFKESLEKADLEKEVKDIIK